MALFAHIAAPQVRLTKDPNTFFFFLDHLNTESPFRLEDDTTWDTNIELGIAWGLRLIEKDEEIYGKNPERQSVRADLGRPGVERRRSPSRCSWRKQRGLPVWVVGVGTSAGGLHSRTAAQDTQYAAASRRSARRSIAPRSP